MNTDAAHIDVAGYALGLLEPAEREAFEAHLSSCGRCRAELDELAPIGRSLTAGGRGPVPEPPPGLEARTLLAVQRAARDERAPAPARERPRHRSRRTPLLLRRPLALGLAVALAALAVAGVALRGQHGPPVEVVATLTGKGGTRAAVSVTETGIGRVIRFDTRDLPILPKGQYYELWWVGPKDRPGRPNRISAGTFHPDPQGRSQVVFAAAVDPAKYPRLAVTAEPGDGDPSPTRPDVLRGRARSPRS